MAAPLEGIKVVELAHILADPGGPVVADLGADVIRVESEKGDDTWAWGPPFIERENDISASYFHGCNQGKKSVTVDKYLKRSRSHQGLVKNSDILIENFKVGV